ncbi:MAG: NAD(P)-dependent oxidoreductase [Gammaproteobacteria bacterium]|nr:NAD(P)-dependent oxidoreductase [Gammaproteobacteria bacterium]
MNIGFIGLGNMGSGMASNLLRYCLQNDHQLTVYDINTSSVESLVAQGARRSDSVAALASSVDIVFTSLPSSVEINAVATGEQGLFENLPQGAVWFETSTNELAEWQALLAAAPSHLSLVDAPVTGGAEGAAAGTLTMLLGIEESMLEQHADLLASFTQKAVRMGPAGAGYVSKLCQLHLNYLVAEGIGETLMLAQKAQLDLAALYSVLQHSCAQSYVADAYIPRVLNGSYDPSFTLGLATKDMRLISGLGEHLGVPLKLADAVYADYQTATQRYGADQPHLQIVKLIEDETGELLRADLDDV